ncbi:MAG: hypothetical protein ACYCPN_04120 [Thermoplasmata archaeon]
MESDVKLHKVVNREYHGKTYYRWILMVPPITVKELGWQEGEAMRMEARGRVLQVRPATEGKEATSRERGEHRR